MLAEIWAVELPIPQYPENTRKMPAKRQVCAPIGAYIPRVTASQLHQLGKGAH